MTRKRNHLLLIALALGCSHQTHTRAAANTDATPEPSVWVVAWGEVASGAKATGSAGPWSIERAQDGAIVTSRELQRVAGRAGEEPSGTAILAEVQTRLATDRNVDSAEIDIAVDTGTVILKGEVPSREQAALSVRTTLDTRSVRRVVSYLRWPVQ